MSTARISPSDAVYCEVQGRVWVTGEEVTCYKNAQEVADDLNAVIVEAVAKQLWDSQNDLKVSVMTGHSILKVFTNQALPDAITASVKLPDTVQTLDQVRDLACALAKAHGVVGYFDAELFNEFENSLDFETMIC